jgi:ribonuclease HII
MLQDMFPDRMVMAREERMARSVYEALGGEHVVRFTFQPRADDEHCCVALASMVSKYVREALMHEFNRFWQTHLPDLKPTAGYPGDSERYYRQIRPVMKKLGLDKSKVWRQR